MGARPPRAVMTVPVALAALAEQVDAFGAVAYAVTAGEAGAPHVVSVTAAWEGDELVVGAGRHTSENVDACSVTVDGESSSAGAVVTKAKYSRVCRPIVTVMLGVIDS